MACRQCTHLIKKWHLKVCQRFVHPQKWRQCDLGGFGPTTSFHQLLEDAEMFFDPANDKIYRHPTFYTMPEGALQIWWTWNSKRFTKFYSAWETMHLSRAKGFWMVQQSTYARRRHCTQQFGTRSHRQGLRVLLDYAGQTYGAAKVQMNLYSEEAKRQYYNFNGWNAHWQFCSIPLPNNCTCLLDEELLYSVLPAKVQIPIFLPFHWKP